MSIETRLLVALLIALVMLWIFRSFARHKLSSGQTLFWETMLGGGLIIALFPPVVQFVSLMWGNLLPVSWISFVGLLSLIAYLLHQSSIINAQQARLSNLARQVAFIEQRMRTTEGAGDHD